MNPDRVLAYTLAKEIVNEDLGEIAGGGAALQMTTKQSLHPSAHNAQNFDMSYDVSVDW